MIEIIEILLVFMSKFPKILKLADSHTEGLQLLGGSAVVTSQLFPCASGVLETRMPFLSSREYCLRLIATACAQAQAA